MAIVRDHLDPEGVSGGLTPSWTMTGRRLQVPSGGPSRAGERSDPGWRQLAGAGLPRGRWHAALHGHRAGPWLTDVDGNRYVDLICSGVR